LTPIEALDGVFAALGEGDKARAAEIAKAEYPFHPITRQGRKATPLQMTRTFIRDGFIDRYSGQKLVFPGSLRLLHLLLPEEFPYDTHWSASRCHRMWWELFPTIDHVVPVARGGVDAPENWVTTSMMRNQAKGPLAG
jgi:hypothetical protein